MQKKKVGYIGGTLLALAMVCGSFYLFGLYQEDKAQKKLASLSGKAANLDIENPDRKEEIEVLAKDAQKVGEDYPKTVAGKKALILAARHYMVLAEEDRSYYSKIRKMLKSSSWSDQEEEATRNAYIGYTFLKEKQWKKAIPYYKKAIEHPCKDRPASLEHLAICYESVNDKEAALVTYQKLLDQHPEYSNGRQRIELKIGALTQAV